MANDVMFNSKEEAQEFIQKIKALGLSGEYDFISYLPKFKVTVHNMNKLSQQEYGRLVSEYPSLGAAVHEVRNEAKQTYNRLERDKRIYDDEERLHDFGKRHIKEMDSDWEVGREQSRPGWTKIAPGKWELKPSPDVSVYAEKGDGGFYVSLKDRDTGNFKAYDCPYIKLTDAEDEAVNLYDSYASQKRNPEYFYDPNKKKFQMRMDI